VKRHESTAADKVFARIVSDINSGAIRPRDTISERDLVKRFGVSRTPVREAVKRLFERGFLEVGPKRVAVVREIDRKAIKDLYELRLQLEHMAAPLTVKHITTGELAKLREINREFSRAYRARELGWMLEVRAQFHAVLVQATRNRWLAKILITLRDDAYIVRHAHWQEPERARQAIEMHLEMIDALAAGQGARYRKLVLQQIRGGLDSYLSRL
jgi:DNA-binding GntR family transcriptional regulator